MVWDEGNAIWRAEGIAAWFRSWWCTPPGRWDTLFASQTIRHYWRYAITLEGHPSFYGLVIAAGRAVAPKGWAPWQQARVGPIVLFALAAASVYYFFRREGWGLAGLAAVAGILFLPHVFAHLQMATPDSPLCSLWIISWVVFCRKVAAARSTQKVTPLGPGRHCVGEISPVKLFQLAAQFAPFGVVLGLTMATKLTGWLAPLPFILWTVLTRRWREMAGVCLALIVATLVFVLVNPPLWHDPLCGVLEFWRRNLDRSAYNVSILFLGRRYDLYHPLPWYNTTVWVAVTVPAFLLLSFVVGLAKSFVLFRSKPWAGLLLLNMLTLLIVRATPWAPPHDGVRLFLPSVVFLGIVAGLGMATMVENLAKRHSACVQGRSGLSITIGRFTGFIVLGLTVGTCLWNLWCYRPHWLSFYNAIAGGPVGARKLGLEVTYYWDALTPEVLEWLETHTRPGEKVYFAAGPYENLLLLKRWGFIHFEFRPDAPGSYRWYVLQHRFGVWDQADAWLVAYRQPAFSKTLFASRRCCLRQDVELLGVYDWKDYEEAVFASGTAKDRK